MALHIIRFYKPCGVLTQFTDPDNRPTLADYIDIPDIYAAGRLDMDSEGLLILTNDRVIKTRLMAPKYAHARTYAVQVERIPDDSDLQPLREGIVVKDYKTRPAKVRLLKNGSEFPERNPPIRYRKNVPTAWLEIILTEGKNRQVRRMTAAIGYPALRLIRTKIGSITLEGLQPGEWKALTPEEIAGLGKSLGIR